MSEVQHVADAQGGKRSRSLRSIVALAGAAVLLASCGSAPGAAAVVAGQSIPEQTVVSRTQALISENVQDPTQSVDPVTRALFNRFQTTDVVRHQLAQAAAKADGITVADAQINAFIAQNGGAAAIGKSLTVPAAAVPDAIYDYLVLQQLVDKIPAAGVDVTDIDVTVDVVPAADRDAAVAARTKYLKDPGALNADAAAAQAAGQQVPGGSESLLADPQDALVGLFTAPEGQIVLVPQGAQGYYVVRVTKRTEKPAKLTKAVVQAASSLDGYLVLASLLLGKYPAADAVTVNPRFGQWDPQTLQVIAPNNGL